MSAADAMSAADPAAHTSPFTPASGNDMSKATINETMVDPTAVHGMNVDGAPTVAAPPVPALKSIAADGARTCSMARVKSVRRSLGLTQEEFAARYGIPLGTLRDWEQGRTEPDRPARAYIRVIASNPEWVCQALASEPC